MDPVQHVHSLRFAQQPSTSHTSPCTSSGFEFGVLVFATHTQGRSRGVPSRVATTTSFQVWSGWHEAHGCKNGLHVFLSVLLCSVMCCHVLFSSVRFCSVSPFSEPSVCHSFSLGTVQLTAPCAFCHAIHLTVAFCSLTAFSLCIIFPVSAIV